MPHKIEIEFPAAFESNVPGTIHLGRLQIGNSVGRLRFGIDGKMHLYIHKGEPCLHLMETPSDDLVPFGLSKE